MRKAMVSAAIAVAVAACSSGGGPSGNGGPPAVAGNYNATFAATQATPGCQGFVTAPSQTTGILRVTQAGSSVTLHISELAEQIASNATGTVSESGTFDFAAQVLLDPDPDVGGDEIPVNGTIDGTFSGSAMNLTFDFTLATCTVVGTITGTRA